MIGKTIIIFAVGALVGFGGALLSLKICSTLQIADDGLKKSNNSGFREKMDDYLLPQNSLIEFYEQSNLLPCIYNIQSVKIHQKGRGMTVGGFTFDNACREVSSHDRLRISRLLLSMNAFKTGKGVPSVFDPDVMLVIEGGESGKLVALLYSPQDKMLRWCIDGVEIEGVDCSPIGLTDVGYGVLSDILLIRQ